MRNEFFRSLAEGKTGAWILFCLIFFAILFVSCSFSFFLGRYIHKTNIKQERKDAIKRSRSVIGGQISEQLAPFLPKFPCNPGDVRFVGKPIDFVGFPGATDGKPIKEILIIEVKTGKSQLNEREKQIKEAIEKGNVRYVVYRC